GVVGFGGGTTGLGVLGQGGTNGNGILGFGGGTSGLGVVGEGGTNSDGILGFGRGTLGRGVVGISPINEGLGTGTTAAQFVGNVNIIGTLSASTKDFRIDDPLDPAHKF